MMPLAPQLSIPCIGQTISTSPTNTTTSSSNNNNNNNTSSTNIAATSDANMKTSNKPKLSFSIDSIVGKRKAFELGEEEQATAAADRIADHLSKSPLYKRHHGDMSAEAKYLSSGSPDIDRSPATDTLSRRSISPQSNGSHYHHHQQQQQQSQLEPISPGQSPSPLSLVTNNSGAHSPSHGLTSSGNPFLAAAAAAAASRGMNIPGHMQQQQQQQPPSMSPTNVASPTAVSTSPPNSAQMPQVAPLGHPNHPMMMAAAAAAAAAAASSAHHHQFPAMPADYQQAAAFYPWFLRANPFAGRFPGMPFDSSLGSFLLPPFRKPKRIRTAFSPGQLLKLEQAFEKNHYVVGNERKQLASHLGLSETQVKVWFQNRRTKHKRQKQEDEESGGSGGSMTNDGGNKSDNRDYSEEEMDDDEEEEEEEIDLEDEEASVSDQEHHQHGGSAPGGGGGHQPHNVAALKFANMHQFWYQSMGAAAAAAAAAGLLPENPPVSSANSN